MKAIDKFIVHVVCNWKNNLNEAYGRTAIEGFIKKFREEAEDLNIDITDALLKSYIEAFDRIKDSLPKDQRDLTKWSLPKLMKIASVSKKGASRDEEEIDITPDVVYHNEDNTIVVYNGSREENCIKYGKGEKWCITRSSFSSYRYAEHYRYPTFYLAKNLNLPQEDKLSFVAIQVRDPRRTKEDERYAYTNRANSPGMSDSMSFESLINQIPWLKEIPDLKSILKYIPLSSTELNVKRFQDNPTTYRNWSKFPYKDKEQYLVFRRGRDIFSDMKVDRFVRDYLPKYPDLATFVAETPGIIGSYYLLQNLDKFSNQTRKSITANLQDPVDSKFLAAQDLPFEVKKLLVKLNKWALTPDQKLYITEDGETIVKLTVGEDIKIGLYQEDDDYPDIKLNKRTSKYLLDYPELDKIPLKNLIKLANEGIISTEVVNKVLDDAKKDPESTIKVKDVDGTDIILDPNSFSTYKKEGNSIEPAPFDSEEVQKAFDSKETSDSFRKKAVALFSPEPGTGQNIPKTVDRDALKSIINTTPYADRIVKLENSAPAIVLVAPDTGNFFLMPSIISPTVKRAYRSYGSYGNPWYVEGSSTDLTSEGWKTYFNYLRATNQDFTDSSLTTILGDSNSRMSLNSKKAFIANNPPVRQGQALKPVMNGETALLVNTANPRQSFKISDSTGKLVNANIPAGLAAQLTGGQPARVPGAGNVQAPQRQLRPPGNYWRQPAPEGNISIANKMADLGAGSQFRQIPGPDLRRLNIDNGAMLNTRTDGGARRRNQMLGNAGQVEETLAALTSRIYIIRLANGTRVISIKIYPGNREYLLIPGQAALQINEPADLIRALRQRNLAEARKYLVRSYLETNPANLNEFKNILRKYINKRK